MKRRSFLAWLSALLFGSTVNAELPPATEPRNPNQTRIQRSGPQPFYARIISGKNPYLCELVTFVVVRWPDGKPIKGIATDVNGRDDLPTETIIKVEPFAGGYRFRSSPRA